MTTRQGTDSNVVLVNQEFDVVGTRPIRHDGADKVTGRAATAPTSQTPPTFYMAKFYAAPTRMPVSSLSTPPRPKPSKVSAP